MLKSETGRSETSFADSDLFSAPTEISDGMISAIIKRIAAGKPVRRKLPYGGYLHIDRQMPFLLVYRRKKNDPFSEATKLLRGESSFLIIDVNRKHHKGSIALVSSIADCLAKSFGAFLLIELWVEQNEEFQSLEPEFRPAFRILTQKKDAVLTYIQTLHKSLSGIKVQRTWSHVEVYETSKPWLPGMPRLISSALSKQISCHFVGIGVRPVFQNQDSKEIFPLLLRTIHRGLGRAVRRSVFRFTNDLTVQRPPHFHALGPRSLVKLVWKVDQELAEINTDFDFLLSVTPINADHAWNAFKRQGFSVNPDFIYRPLPIDPIELKRQLYKIPIEKIEDPALEALFRAQRAELERKLTMLSDRGNRNFFYGSLQLYGPVSAALLKAAQDILNIIPVRKRSKTPVKQLTACEFAALAEREIHYYRNKYPHLSSRVEIRDDVVGVLVSQGNLLLNSRQKIAENRIEALLAHEIGTHVLTYVNGQAQPFRQLYSGLPDYEELQEGIAVFAEYLTGGLTGPRLRLLAARVIAADMLINGAEFTDVFKVLDNQYRFNQRTAFNIALRIYRGGGFLKDMVYLRGLIRVLEYLGNDGAFEPLLLGKFGAGHLHIIRELQWRKVLSPPMLTPKYLEIPETKKRLEQVRKGMTLQDLITRI